MKPNAKPNLNPKDFNSTLELMQYKNALDQVVNLAITDLQGRILHINDRMCKLTKYARKELIGQDFQILNSKVHPRGYFQKMWETVIRGEVWSGEICNKAKDGSLYWEDSVVVPLFDGEGLFHQFLTIRKEITEQKRAQEAVQNMISDACPERGVGFFDALSENLSRILKGSDTFIIEYKDKSSDVICHVGSRETINDYRSVTESDFAKRAASSKDVLIERGVVGLGSAGRSYEFAIGLPLINANQECIGLILVTSEQPLSNDKGDHLKAILEVFRRQAVREMDQKKKAMEASELARKLIVCERKVSLGILAQEFNGQVFPALSSVIKDLDQLQTPEGIAIQQKLKNIFSDQKDILSASLNLQFSKVHFSDILDNVLLLTRDKYSETGVILDIVNQNPSTTVFGDEIALTQAIVNLLFNAIKVASRAVRKEVRIAIKEEGPSVSLVLSHYGEPPTKEIKETLNKPLIYHAQRNSNVIGLYVSKKIFEAHGGKLELSLTGLECQFIATVSKEAQMKQGPPSTEEKSNNKVAS